MKKENIRNEILKLVNALDLIPSENIHNIMMYLNNNELGVALDALCSQLYENDIKISNITYKKIEEIGELMGMSYSTWNFLRKFIDDTI